MHYGAVLRRVGQKATVKSKDGLVIGDETRLRDYETVPSDMHTDRCIRSGHLFALVPLTTGYLAIWLSGYRNRESTRGHEHDEPNGWSKLGAYRSTNRIATVQPRIIIESRTGMRISNYYFKLQKAPPSCPNEPADLPK